MANAQTQTVVDCLPTGGRHVPRILLFDTQASGHHTSYVTSLVSYYLSVRRPVELIIAAPASLIEQDEGARAARQNELAIVRQFCIPETDLSRLRTTRSAAVRSLREWRLFTQICRFFRPDHALAMYFDSLQLGAAVLGCMPCSWSGIYFRPRFHYRSLSWERTTRSLVAELRQRTILRAAFARRNFHSLFCLDPLAVEASARHGVRLQFCPDPIPPAFEVRMSDREQTPAKGNPQDRKRFLFFGQLSGRKNLRGVVEALESLPFLVRRQIELCVAGPMESGQERATADLLRRLCALEGLAVDAVLRHLSSAETADVFADADIVLLPYMQHVGMSSVLVLAARASKPVIATCCGLLGHLVRERCLGISADCSDLHNLAGAFRQALSSPPHTMYDAAARRQLANDHAVEYFGAVIARGIDANIC